MGINKKIRALVELHLPHILTKVTAGDLVEYGSDALKLYQPDPAIILFPKSTEEVSQIVRFANNQLISLVPSGGRTGLSAGATASTGEIVVSLEKMNRLIQFHPEEQTLEVEAGMITEELQRIAQSHDLHFPVDFASVGSSQIGGNIATNAGGIHVIRYGMTREWVTGLKVVTGNGDILDLNKGLAKNNTGLDFRHLFIGSEGILGIITEATIRLTTISRIPSTFFLGIDQLEQVTDILKWMKSKVNLSAFEFFTKNALQFALKEGVFDYALDKEYDYYIICEFDEIFNDPTIVDKASMESKVIDGLLDTEMVAYGIVASSDLERKNIWKHREHIPSALNKYSPYKNDISVRIKDIPAFVNKLNDLLKKKYANLEVAWFGHIGDGNLHVNIPKPPNMDITTFREDCDRASQDLYKLIGQFGGSISAEHGVGKVKKEALHYSRMDQEIALMREIKRAFDPNGIMNPNKII